MWVQRIVITGVVYCLFALAVASTYAIVQHDGRSSVEDGPRALLSAVAADGGPAGVGQSRVDLARNTGLFWTRYDRADRPVAGNGYLAGSLADVPPGVIDTARERTSDAVTWQPTDQLRFAIVAESEPGGDVLVAGQSLGRTEQRAEQSLVIAILALFGGAVVAAAGLAVLAVADRRSDARLRSR